MASRHLSRSVALQTLFECDAKNAISFDSVKAVLARNLKHEKEGADEAFALFILRGILDKKEEIDAIIVKAAPQWPLDKIAPIDRNVLRIGLFELLWGDRTAVPPKVALNEAIELAKSYGGESSGKFVNGVLGAVYRDIGEPGKTEASKHPESTTEEHLGGVLLVSQTGDALSVALVHDAFGKWTLPKAQCAEGEAPENAALRALREELGVEATLATPLGEHTYTAHNPKTGRIQRTVQYFLAMIESSRDLSCKVCEGITEVKWFSADSLSEIEMYPDLEPIIRLGITAAKSA